MEKFIKSILNDKKLCDKIIVTFLILIVFRLGLNIVLPGVDIDKLSNSLNLSLGENILNIFSGGGLTKSSIFSLGIAPYYSATILMSFFNIILKIKSEYKYTQGIRILTVFMAFVQAIPYLKTTIPLEAMMYEEKIFLIINTILLCSMSVFMMWLCELMTKKGLCKGLTFFPAMATVLEIPSAIIDNFTKAGLSNLLFFIIGGVCLVILLILLLQLTFLIKEGKRNIGIDKNGATIFLKVVNTDDKPIGFAQSIITLIALLFYRLFNADFSNHPFLADSSSIFYVSILFFIVLVLTFWYTATSYENSFLFENLKANKENITLNFEDVFDRLTLITGIFLGILAILPFILSNMGIPKNIAIFFGGASILFLTDTVTEIIKEFEPHLIKKVAQN